MSKSQELATKDGQGWVHVDGNGFIHIQDKPGIEAAGVAGSELTVQNILNLQPGDALPLPSDSYWDVRREGDDIHFQVIREGKDWKVPEHVIIHMNQVKSAARALGLL